MKTDNTLLEEMLSDTNLWRVYHPDGTIAGEAEEVRARTIITIENPCFWWPRGYGEQPLYRVDIALKQRGEIFCRRTMQVGLRTVRLNEDADDYGNKFQIEINGVPVFVRGADYVPQDSFAARVESGQIQKLIVTLLVSTFFAYGVSRFKFRGRKMVLRLLLVSQMFPLVLLIIPIFTIFIKLQIVNTYLSLIIAYHRFPKQVRFFHSEPTYDLFTPCMEEGFDAAMLTGMHAMSGGEDRGCWRHTVSPPPLSRAYSAIDTMWFNGTPVGETGIFAAFCGVHGVPLVYVSGDAWACREAEKLIPGVQTCAVKEGKSFFSALSLHPARAAELSAQTALCALHNPNGGKPLTFAPPFVVRTRFAFAHRAADAMQAIPGARRVDETTVEITYESAAQFRREIGCLRAPEDELHQRDTGFERVTGLLTRYGPEPYTACPSYGYPVQADFAAANWGEK